MGGTTSAQKAPMALEIEVELSRVRNFLVNNSSSFAVATAVGSFLVLREKSNVMSFANDNDGNLGVNTKLSTST